MFGIKLLRDFLVGNCHKGRCKRNNVSECFHREVTEVNLFHVSFVPQKNVHYMYTDKEEQVTVNMSTGSGYTGQCMQLSIEPLHSAMWRQDIGENMSIVHI